LAVDVIKIPHHGSRNQSVKFAQRSQARIAIVSVGADNAYGHPAPETIFLYESIGAKVIRTDQHGSVAVSSTQGNLVVSTQK
jgi:competence protein ComEC